MLRTIGRRLLFLIPTLFGLSILLFAWVRALPGGPAVALLGEKATPEAVARVNELYGFDKPLIEQRLMLVPQARIESFLSGEPVLPVAIRLAEAADDRDDEQFMAHTMAYRDVGPDGSVSIRLDYKPVTVTRYQPMERKY